MKPIALLTSTAAVLASLTLAAAPATYAQDQGAHDEHHPVEQATPQPAQPATPPAQQSPGGMMGMMSPEMMQQMMQQMMGDGMPMMPGMMGGQSGMAGRGMAVQPTPGITIIINTHDMPGMMGGSVDQPMMGGPMSPGMMGQQSMAVPNPSAMAYRQAVMSMHQGMNMPSSGDPDVDFARMMIPHHQGAIDVARSQLANGKDPQLRQMAQEIIAAQEREIATLQRWLADHPQ